jgi:putative addiction module component (TIGR02574 family)
MMPPSMKELGIDQWNPAERADLALEIWESLGPIPGVPLPISSELKAELERRDAELDAHPESALTWEQIRGGIENRS